MSVRLLNKQDGGIVERRLRPIYEWLDNGNNKKALQEAEKVLKKSPTLQSARALRALALLRLGKSSEAQAVLETLAGERPSDDSTLQAMTICYRESHQLNKVCEIYEAAVKAEPTNEELHSHLFMSYVRVGDYLSQQRAAMALYKFAPKNPYYFWAVMSIVWQAKSSPDASRRGILLILAQRMVDNIISEGRLECEQEARLYIMILELQEKWEDIIRFQESPLYNRLMPGAMPQVCMQYLKKTGDFRRLHSVTRELLLASPDRWDYYMMYFDSVFQLMKEGDMEVTPEGCHEFLCSIIEAVPGRPLRGPHLARLELWRRMAEVGDPTALLGSLPGLCAAYLRTFGTHASALSDVREHVTAASCARDAEQLLHSTGLQENSEPTTQQDIQAHINCLGAYYLASDGVPAPGRAAALRRQYARCARAGLAPSSATDAAPADLYAVMAAHMYYYEAVQARSPAPVVSALRLLEVVRRRSPANYHVKLLLVRLYHVLGAGLAADAAHARLDLKHVQLSSLRWLHAGRLARALQPSRALAAAQRACAFHAQHMARDHEEQLTFAYKYGTFDKLVELSAWARRLGACAAARASAAERCLLPLLRPPAAPAPLPPAPHALSDNRDLRVMVSWRRRGAGLRARTFADDAAALAARAALAAAACACTDLARAGTPEERAPHIAVLERSAATLRAELSTPRAPPPDDLTAPFPAAIHALTASSVPYCELYSCTLQLALALAGAGPVGATGAGPVGAVGAVGAAAGALEARLAGSARLLRVAERLAGDALSGYREVLEELAHYFELLSIVTHVLGFASDVTRSSRRGKKKSPSQSPEEADTSDRLAGLNAAARRCLADAAELVQLLPRDGATGTMSTCAEPTTDGAAVTTKTSAELSKDGATSLEKPPLDGVDDDLADLFSDLECSECPVAAQLAESRRAAAEEAEDVIKCMTKYLKSLAH